MQNQTRISIPKDIYKEQYSERFADRWDELVNWQGRWEAEGNFFIDLLQWNGVKTVLDAACGTGFHAVTLKRAGFDVTASDGAPQMVRKARENADRFDMPDLNVVEAEWGALTEQFDTDSFDAVLCLGNAFTHVLNERDRLDALGQMYSLLHPGGLLLIDQRNYDCILDKGFGSKPQPYFFDPKVIVQADSISEDVLTIRYTYPDGEVHHLTFYPIRQSHLTSLLDQTGFRSVTRFGDFDVHYDHYNANHIFQLAQK